MLERKGGEESEGRETQKKINGGGGRFRAIVIDNVLRLKVYTGLKSSRESECNVSIGP